MPEILSSEYASMYFGEKGVKGEHSTTVQYIVLYREYWMIYRGRECCVLTEQELSEILLINWQCSNIMQYLNRESWKNIFTWKRFEKCVREKTFHLATLNIKVHKLITLLKMLKKFKQEWQKSPAGTRQTDGKNLVWFGEIERKLAKLSKTTFTYRSSS